MKTDKTRTESNTDSETAARAAARPDPGEEHLGAVEGDRPTDHPNQGNRNAPALDDEGLPNDPIAICEDVIGANVDETEGG